LLLLTRLVCGFPDLRLTASTSGLRLCGGILAAGAFCDSLSRKSVCQLGIAPNDVSLPYLGMSQATTARLLGQLLTAHQAAVGIYGSASCDKSREWLVVAAKTVRKDE
jgi:hypothetical protein